ncbi:nucleoid-associated protein [Thiocapsa roseopersicina]|uniref:Uncharacterized protein n=1 Tax=Thiocapsa roseopersicina TaxID=1058 RepID=A0A1H2QJH5_THIRO|nr:nucleoid-associated protein [Thiocapsa roseopersicina]SDW07367.1 hypothetical protein SAMN05421783_101305 [Thiocapsa roseopersicina]
MTSPIEGVLNHSQREGLEIEEFIFHIIEPNATDASSVIFLDEVQLQSKQKSFFLDRLRDIAEGTQYVFKPDSVHLKEKCEQIVGSSAQFVELSRHIAADFSERHQGQMAAGVFVVSVVKYLVAPNDWRRLVFLVKMDKRPSFSYSYTEQQGRRVAVVEEIENSLNETKSAIQKSALIDVADQFVWDVLAFDRVTRTGLSDYFRNFLGIRERQEDSTLTRKAHATVRKWAKALSFEQLAPGEDANTIAGRSLNYLSDHDAFDTDSYLDAVIRDTNDERKALLVACLREWLSEAGVSGQLFRPQPGSLKSKERKQVYVTAEGVTIAYEGSPEVAGITVKELSGSRRLIQIETNRLEIKG